MIRSLLAGALGALLCLQAAPAASQTAPSTEEIRQAQARWTEGKRSFEAGNYEAARVAFRQALTAYPHPALLQNLGEAELRLGRHVEAARHLSQYLRQATGISATQRDVVAKSLEKAAAHLASIVVDTNTDNAEVKVDGEVIGRSPLNGAAWYVEPGRHVVVAHKDGYVDGSETTEVWMGAPAKRIALTLKPMSDSTRAAPPSHEAGANTASSDAESTGPISTSSTSTASHTRGSATSATSGAMSTDSAPSVSAGGGTARTIVLVGEGVLVAAGLAVGVAYFIGANNARDDMAIYQEWVDKNLAPGQSCAGAVGDAQLKCDGLDQSARDRDMNQYVSIAGFVGAGLAATALVTTLVFWKPATSVADTLLPVPRLAIAPSHHSASLTWTF